MNDPTTGAVLLVFAFALGGIVGSFLNACIYRMPRGISLNNPSRSFCPACKKQISWAENIPLLSWLFLRGRCSQCGAAIPARYFLVEVLTATLFVVCWNSFGWPLAVVYWLFVALLITATFIDFEHLIIPDEITLGGTALGLILSTIFPQMMGEYGHLRGLLFSFIGAVSGYLLLWAVVELGKIAFGKKRHAFTQPEEFSVRMAENTNIVVIEGEETVWEDIFSRPKDELLWECEEFEMAFESGERRSGTGPLRMRYDRIFIGEEEILLPEIRQIEGRASALTMPREAMGFGDVKFIAAIGAFLGWKAVLFTIFAAALIGMVVGALTFLITRGKSGGRIPFGPYLALGALLWIFFGVAVLDWYIEITFG
ncbi:MAG: prepilin peptidase [Chthoniobacterales bacterium]